MIEAAPLILSLQLDPTLTAAADALRREHFPPGRNFLSAHVTLFHHLPGAEADAVTAVLRATCAAIAPLPVTMPSVRFLGRGVAIDLGSDALLRVRGELARAFAPWLTAQDRQGFRPHITVQNKVDAAEARGLYERLRRTWTPLSGEADGLLLWHYRGGPWDPAGAFPFARLNAPGDRRAEA